MKKVAIFVEGLTEQHFVKSILLEIFGKNHIQYVIKQARGGNSSTASLKIIEAHNLLQSARWHFSIIECGGDSKIKSDILDHRQSLIREGFTHIIGIRDVYPIDRTQIESLYKGLVYGTPTKDIRIDYFLCIMEVEAWFLAEASHFVKISPKLTCDYIKAEYGIDLLTDDLEQLNNPATDLNNIYKLAGFAYNKRGKNIERTVRVLNYSELFYTLPEKVSSLKPFTNFINSLF